MDKKIGATVIAMLLAACLFSCGKTNSNGSNENTQTGVTDSGTSDGQISAHIHIASDCARENETKSTCTENGSYDEVVYCSVCGREMSRMTKSIDKAPHQYEDGKCTYCKTEKLSEGLKFRSNGIGTCSVSGIGSCKDANIVIPAVAPSGACVTAIDPSAFYNCTGLTGVRIPDTVTGIGDNAFAYCANLEGVTLSDCLTSFGAGVFSGCSSLNFTRSDGLCYLGSAQNPYFVLVKAGDKTKSAYEANSNTVFVASNAFSACTNATSIVIHSRVTDIGSGAFQGCSALKSVTLSENLTAIGSNLFSNCRMLEAVDIPNGVTKIENHAFSFCSSLKRIKLPDGLTDIGSYAFYFCSALTEISIPDTVSSIQDSAFQDCSSLVSVDLPSGIDCISDCMFKNCSALKNIGITGKVLKIERWAFENCTSLERIVIPSKVQTIEGEAFKNCSRLTGVRFENATGWCCFEGTVCINTDLNLTDEVKNALYLSFRFAEYTWRRTV